MLGGWVSVFLLFRVVVVPLGRARARPRWGTGVLPRAAALGAGRARRHRWRPRPEYRLPLNQLSVYHVRVDSVVTICRPWHKAMS